VINVEPGHGDVLAACNDHRAYSGQSICHKQNPKQRGAYIEQCCSCSKSLPVRAAQKSPPPHVG
jgi:hypothetical protein